MQEVPLSTLTGIDDKTKVLIVDHPHSRLKEMLEKAHPDITVLTDVERLKNEIEQAAPADDGSEEVREHRKKILAGFRALVDGAYVERVERDARGVPHTVIRDKSQHVLHAVRKESRPQTESAAAARRLRQAARKASVG